MHIIDFQTCATLTKYALYSKDRTPATTLRTILDIALRQESTWHVMHHERCMSLFIYLFDLGHQSKAAGAALPSTIPCSGIVLSRRSGERLDYVTHRAQSSLMLVLICTLKMEVQPNQTKEAK